MRVGIVNADPNILSAVFVTLIQATITHAALRTIRTGLDQILFVVRTSHITMAMAPTERLFISRRKYTVRLLLAVSKIVQESGTRARTCWTPVVAVYAGQGYSIRVASVTSTQATTTRAALRTTHSGTTEALVMTTNLGLQL